jgi:hypothetical protein
MIVSGARQFIFVHNPKAAGTAFRSAIAPWHDHPVRFWGRAPSAYLNTEVDLAHLRAWELPVVAPDVFVALDSHASLAFLRDPLARFLSACAEHFRNFHPKARFARWGPLGQRLLIHRLIRSGRIQAGVRGDPAFVHFSPQIWFTHLGERQIVRHLLPIRSDRDDFAPAFALLGLEPTTAREENRTQGADWHALASPTVETFVRDFYARDYELLDHLALGCAWGKPPLYAPPLSARRA